MNHKKQKTVIDDVREYMGKTGMIELAGMTFEVSVTGYKKAYGYDILQISPKRGEGTKFIRAEKLILA